MENKIPEEKNETYKNQPSEIQLFRRSYAEKGWELINITQLCEFKLGHSGSCNDFREPDDEIYHIQIWYRGDNIAVFGSEGCYVIDEYKYCIFSCRDEPLNHSDFIIFKMCKVV